MTMEDIFSKILTALFFIVFIALYGGINYYIGRRVWSGTFGHFTIVNKKVYWVIFWIIVLAYIIAALLRNYPSVIVEKLELIGSLWMGMLFYLFIAFIFIDLVKFLIRFIRNEALHNLINKGSFQLSLSAVIGILVVAFLIYGIRSAAFSKITRYDIKVDKAVEGDGIKVVMVSDIHIGGIIGKEKVKKMVEEINNLKPDIVLIAGDIIDSSLEPFRKNNMKEIFNNITSTHGVYAALGNHDGFGEATDEVVKEYGEAGIKVLRDEVVLVANSIYIGGRMDVSIARANGITRTGIDEMLKNIDKSKPIIIMDHQPLEFGKVQEAGADILLSGHTHRGQLAPSNLITSRIFELDYGYLQKENLNVIVSSGYGTWGPPMRIGSQSEIVEIKLND